MLRHPLVASQPSLQALVHEAMGLDAAQGASGHGGGGGASSVRVARLGLAAGV